MIGGLDVLNCSAGHLKLSFDPDKPDEVAKAQQVLSDCMRRGYAVLVEKDGEHHRVKGFDKKTNEYIIEEKDEPKQTSPSPEVRTAKKGQRGTKQARLVASRHRATAIGPTAGG